jgi:hypothetical protein
VTDPANPDDQARALWDATQRATEMEHRYDRLTIAMRDMEARLRAENDGLRDLARRMITEWQDCTCPYGDCPAYPHPVMREAAEAAGWDAPEGVQPWQDRTEAWQKGSKP